MNGSAGHHRTVVGVLIGALAFAIACCSAPAGAATGFGQIEGAGGCLLESGSPATSECAAGEGIFHPKALAVSPDGTNVYVVGGIAGDSIAQSFGTIAILKRNPASGELTDVGCLSSDGTDGREGASGICTSTPSLLGADGVAVSGDGRTVFVTASASGSIVAFARSPATGLLARLGCFQDAPRPGAQCRQANVFAGSDDLLANAEDSALYVASPSEGTISALTAPAATAGQSTAAGASSEASAAPTVASLFTALPGPFTANPCIAVNGLDGGCAVGVAMKGVGGLTLSPEDNQLYGVASGSHAIDVFTPAGASGLAETGCVMTAAPPGICTSSQFLSSPTQLAISPDGRSAYVADQSSRGGKIDTFSRNAANGQLATTGCVDYLPQPVKPEPSEEHEEAPAKEAEKEPSDPCTSVPGLESVETIAISADGSQLYAFGANSAVSFVRDPNTGALSETACASNSDPRCSSLADLSGVQAAAVSPDGRDVYVVTTNTKALLAFGVGASVTSTATAASQRGIAVVDVACPAHLSRPCRGRVALTATVERRARQHKDRPQVLRVALGDSGLFALAAGRRKDVAVRLYPFARSLLRRHGRLRATAVVRAQPRAGGSGWGSRLVLHSRAAPG